MDSVKGVDLAQLASEAERGAFGDLEDWLRAEARWGTRGISSQDSASWNGGRYLTEKIALVGAPYPSVMVTTSSESRLTGVKPFFDFDQRDCDVFQGCAPHRRAHLLAAFKQEHSKVSPGRYLHVVIPAY